MFWWLVLIARGEMGPTSQTDELSQPGRPRETALRDDEAIEEVMSVNEGVEGRWRRGEVTAGCTEILAVQRLAVLDDRGWWW
jgi:hypothetical protein